MRLWDWYVIVNRYALYTRQTIIHCLPTEVFMALCSLLLLSSEMTNKTISEPVVESPKEVFYKFLDEPMKNYTCRGCLGVDLFYRGMLLQRSWPILIYWQVYFRGTENQDDWRSLTIYNLHLPSQPNLIHHWGFCVSSRSL